MGWPRVGIRGGLRRARGEVAASLAACLPCLRVRVRPLWRLEEELEREVLAQLLERGE
jgi:hypothetical protein